MSSENRKRLRLLDVDDLIVLSRLLTGDDVTKTARFLGLTQPAISQRIRKMEGVFEVTLVERLGRKKILTEFGRAAAEVSEKVLWILENSVTANPESYHEEMRPEPPLAFQ